MLNLIGKSYIIQGKNWIQIEIIQIALSKIKNLYMKLYLIKINWIEQEKIKVYIINKRKTSYCYRNKNMNILNNFII